jgi:alcohol dehydrogenase (cytochrome c)
MVLKKALMLAVSVLALASSGNRLMAQGATSAMLLHPPPDSWPGYHGDYSGRRHSPLTQITPANVHQLSLAWAFQSQQRAGIKASPLTVDGIIYFTAIDHVWALDARTCHPIW